MDQPDRGTLAAELPRQLQRELTRALASKQDAPDLYRYIRWLQASINRLHGNHGAQEAQAVYDEWVATRPRSARRATNSGPHVHA
ncbi:hypothetical protein GCM10011492_02390 [Flexivirga endophytica]|uniref:Uncharacterized protein n=1 Tax=Flexivirga endophytica TaxID=1849103 RepID=A0A916STN2_9MICO|nr:hypothetical protein [Flexivirga endophytica]GGB16192.1 hypothetical protein GCM10011492_02390 [Flexivirga endophytica]GHB39422.1 hypothetical protein GCM10008112_05220 [Flexivirga endophytica]